MPLCSPAVRSLSVGFGLALAACVAGHAKAQCEPDPLSWVFASDNQYCDLIVVEWDYVWNATDFELWRSETSDFADAVLIGYASPPYYDGSVAGNVGYTYFPIGINECGRAPVGASDIGYSNFGLYLVQSPTDQTVKRGDTASFSVRVRGFGAFQWFRDGEFLLDDGRISGTPTATLTINNVNPADAGEYSCEIYGGCGTLYSDIATLTVVNPCFADFNQDGFVDFFDYLDFVRCFEGEFCTGLGTADVNGDGFVDFFDFEDFVAVFEAGC